MTLSLYPLLPHHRDLLLTRSSIGFGFEMAKQSQISDDFSGFYHYAPNQSMAHTPISRSWDALPGCY
ncbi:hypothetical protein F4824DRAFT_484687 [Ustulina deusta]|nr:hypothetical protein F4824DRAFT_484687 [Ustulina deusta]